MNVCATNALVALQSVDAMDRGFFIYLIVDSASAIGYTRFSAHRRNHFLAARDGQDATSLTDNRARNRMTPRCSPVWLRR
jgi:hypothetical protein